MKPKSISALVFKVPDMEKTLEFYEGLGFRVERKDEGLAIAYVNWFAAEFHLANETDTGPKDGPIVLISVDVKDFYEKALAAGYKPETELQKTVNGRTEFFLRDPSGYLLSFFEKK